MFYLHVMVLKPNLLKVNFNDTRAGSRINVHNTEFGKMDLCAL